jgi:hypothetical protein
LKWLEIARRADLSFLSEAGWVDFGFRFLDGPFWSTVTAPVSGQFRLGCIYLLAYCISDTKNQNMNVGYLLSLLLAGTFGITSAKVACETDDICIAKLRLGSTCVDGYCTNPFASGCLRRHFGEERFPNLRVCNSDDPPHFEEEGICSNEPLRYLNYTEIRVAPADWDSAILLAWLYQILLSELMDVPVSIERGEGSAPGTPTLSFYDIDNAYGENFPVTSYSLDGVQRANEIGGDCRETDEPCAHVLPEVWPGVEPHKGSADVMFSGQMGIEGFWMPKYTLEKDPSLGTFFGLTGEANREK